MGYAISPITVAALKHLSIHGVCSLADMRAALPALQAKTMNNLVQLAHVLRTEAGFSITPKGRAKLKASEPQGTASEASEEEETPESHTMVAAASPRLVAQRSSTAKAPAAPMLSALQTEDAIAHVLQRARVRISLQDVCRRAHLPEHIVRPALTIMVQAGRIEGTNGKPALYRLAKQSLRHVNTHMGRGPSDHPSGYTCPELQRNPGLQDDRFEAFKLPSRINDRLHWPDGVVTAVGERREVTA
jgi:hypothetical protein